MNYERLTKLADLLNEHHGDPNRYGFVISPENERLQMEHKDALVHAGRLFNYQLVGTERLGILCVTREEDDAQGVNYRHIRLEEADHGKLTRPELAPLLDEQMEYKKSQITEY